MLNHRREMHESVEEKFLIDGQKYHVYVNGQEEINKLIMYLKYDFVKHQSMKNPTQTYIEDNEFVVSCDHRLSLVANYPSDRMLGFFFDFEGMKEDALPLNIFMNKEEQVKHPEYFI